MQSLLLLQQSLVFPPNSSSLITAAVYCCQFSLRLTRHDIATCLQEKIQFSSMFVLHYHVNSLNRFVCCLSFFFMKKTRVKAFTCALRHPQREILCVFIPPKKSHRGQVIMMCFYMIMTVLSSLCRKFGAAILTLPHT